MNGENVDRVGADQSVDDAIRRTNNLTDRGILVLRNHPARLWELRGLVSRRDHTGDDDFCVVRGVL